MRAEYARMSPVGADQRALEVGSSQWRDEPVAVAAASEELADGEVVRGERGGAGGRVVQEGAGVAEEPADVAEHAEERRPEEVAGLREQRPRAAERVLEPTRATSDRRAPCRSRLDPTPSSSRRPLKAGYVLVLKTRKPVSRRHVRPPWLDVVRVRVAAEAVVGLVEHDVVHARERQGGPEARDPSSDDGDAHADLPARIDGGDGPARRTRAGAYAADPGGAIDGGRFDARREPPHPVGDGAEAQR